MDGSSVSSHGPSGPRDASRATKARKGKFQDMIVPYEAFQFYYNNYTTQLLCYVSVTLRFFSLKLTQSLFCRNAQICEM